MPRKTDPARTAQRRKQILAATFRLFARRRFDQITIQDVAAEAGVSKGTVLYYFRTKERLFLALQEGLAAYLERRLDDALGAAEPEGPWAQIYACVDALFVGPEENLDYYAAFTDFVSLARSESAFEKVNRHIVALCEDRMARVVTDGQSEGAFRRDVWPQDVGVVWRALVDGIHSRWVLEGHPLGSRRFERYRAICKETLHWLLRPVRSRAADEPQLRSLEPGLGGKGPVVGPNVYRRPFTRRGPAVGDEGRETRVG